MEFVNKDGFIPLSSYLQCETNCASEVFSIWLFFARFESALNIVLPDLKEFSLGLLLYAGENINVEKQSQSYFIEIIETLGMRLASFLMSNEADLPILFDETQVVNHIVSCHEALLKFVANFDCVRSKVDSNSWMFVLLAILLLHSPSHTSLFDQTITDLCDAFLSSTGSSPSYPSLLMLFKEAINLASLTNCIRDSLIFSVNPLTGEIVSRGRPKTVSFVFCPYFIHRKKKLSSLDQFRMELNQLSTYLEDPYSLKKRTMQRKEERLNNYQQLWLNRLVQECVEFLPHLVQGSLVELAESIGLATHPFIAKLQATLEECRQLQKEENQNVYRVTNVHRLRQLQPTFCSPTKNYYFLSSDQRRVYFTVARKKVSSLVSKVAPLCNRRFYNGM